ncbi:hypothetical protein ESOMN_v1c06190 [Williamsoniiplasma somnilux]|uniref:Uncharacterized protein n=1 Tax=Williamsoniiplasma somnilux TaxID=215578 RepID=A0A2K8P1W8_9MOLU|nr:hypothetical protein [Williamsoniiplasma somnilux]ATZ19001.1 hypothetical protein ESOMN_v1c06190 [Williamsoniiplasma somnilux]
MKVSARQGVITALVGVMISIFGAIIQFLMIYWILNAYGTEFNGFVRIATALSILGGSTEGALGITTVVMLMKPMANNDWIEANEIFSTAKKKYKKGMVTGTLLVSLVALVYPLELALAPVILNGDPLKWGIQISNAANEGVNLVPIWQLIGLIFILGSKQILTAGFFGIYENVLMADQKNMVRKVAVLLADTIVYGTLFYLMNLSIDNVNYMAPIVPFLILLIYAPIRGFAMKIYVKRYYPLLKFYPDFNSYTLLRSTTKMWRANLGKSVLMNIDLIVLFVVLGTSGLRTTSMLSLYLIIGVNLRLILTNLIVSFREYFIGIIAKDGRLSWESYSKYELYTFVIAAFSFIIMSIVAPYIVTGLYGDVVANDLSNLQTNILNARDSSKDLSISLFELNAQKEAFKFIFSDPTFSSLYGAGTAFILLFEGQLTLIQAKRRFGDVARTINWSAIIYVLLQVISTLTVVLIKENNTHYIKNVILVFYILKLSCMTFIYIYMWQYTWKRVTYNSTFKYSFTNIMSLTLPIGVAVIVNMLLIVPKFPLNVMISGETIQITLVTIPLLLGMLTTVSFLGIGATLILPIILRPSVGLSILILLPIIKQLVNKSKEKSKLKRLQTENLNIKQIVGDQKETMLKAINGFDEINDSVIDEKEFFKKYQSTEKPKIFKVKGVKKID